MAQAIGTNAAVTAETTENKPVAKWTIEDVSDWARKDFNFDDEDIAALEKAKLTGRRLFLIENKKELTDANFSLGAASDLWAAIQKLKKPLDLAVPTVFRQMRSPSRTPLGTHYRSRSDEYERDYGEQSLQESFSTPRRLNYDESFNNPSNVPNNRRSFSPTYHRQGYLGASSTRKRKRDSEGEREQFDEDCVAKKPRLEIKVNRRTASLIGRDKEMAQIFNIIDSNIHTLYTRPSTIIISGTCGIGKTCLALHIAQAKQFDLCLATIIRPNCATLAHEIFKDNNATTVETALKNWISPHILAGEQKKRMKVVIYLDEIQYLAAKELDVLRSGIVSFILAQEDEIAIQLIVSGVAAAFLPGNPNGDIDVSYGGFRVFNLQPLDLEDSAKLFTEFLKLDGRYTNFSAIVHQPAVQQALQWAGGNARLIEFLAAKVTRDDNDFQTLHHHVINEYKNAYPSRFSFNIHMYACLINACLAQIPVMFDAVLTSKKYDESISVSKLIKNGIAGFKALKGEDADYYRTDVAGYLSAPLFELHCFRSLLKFPINYQFLEPRLKWTWSDFEWFIGELITCRLNALHDLNKISVTFREFFGEFLAMPTELEETSILLSTFKYHELQTPHKTAQEINTSLPDESFVVVRNGDKAPSWDTAVYANKSLKLAVQIKHTHKEDGGTAVTMKVIREERAKVPSEIPLLFITNRLTNDKEELKLKNTVVVLKKDLPHMLGIFKFYQFTE